MIPIKPASPPDHALSPEWGQSLSTGAAGIALLHIEYARAGTGTWTTAHEWIVAMTRSPVTACPNSCGLYHGAPAVAFTLHAAGHSAYATALDTVDRHITTLTRRRLALAHERIDRRHLPALREFDLISGLTGIGVYLLGRHSGGDLLRDVLTYLVRLTEPLKFDGEVLPGWWCGDGPAGQPSRRWPGGHANLGMAHGIAGPLALLSTALRRGVAVAGQYESINRICRSLDQWCCGTGPQAWWPGIVSRSELHARAVRLPGPQRPSWCYGTPGLARAQQIAALVLADPRRQRRAEEALIGCVTDDRQLSQLSDASLCHGWAGLLQSAWHADTDAGGKLAEHLPYLRTRMEDHLHRHGMPVHNGVLNGLLEGTAGIRLVQHTTAENDPSVTRWDACLLLDG